MTETAKTQIDRDQGADARAALAQMATGPLLPLADGVDLENQLKVARQAVCVSGEPNPVCALLVRMSLLLAEDIGAEPQIRERYAELIEAQGAA